MPAWAGSGLFINSQALKYHFQQKTEKMLGSWLVLYV
jgi:hypothetical protein